MSKSKKLDITGEVRYRYRTGSKKERGEILSSFCELSGYGRKHAGRILRGKFKSRKTGKPRGRKPKY